MEKQWEILTKWPDGNTKRHYCGDTEKQARYVFGLWKEDMDKAVAVQLLSNSELVEEYTSPRKTRKGKAK